MKIKMETKKIELRRWNKKEDGPLESWMKKPVYVIDTSEKPEGRAPTISKAFAYSAVEAANRLAQNIINEYRSKLELQCNDKEIPDDLYEAADSMITHHNAFIDILNPEVDNNPFRLRRQRLVRKLVRDIG